MHVKLASGILAIAMMAVPRIAMTQDNQNSTDDSTHTATGCLGKSSTANTYMLTDEDGKLWDLRSKTVRLGPHVGHTVTVTGTIPEVPKNDSPVNTSPQNHLAVTSLKMVRDNCKRP
jgi:hypothetical protein